MGEMTVPADAMYGASTARAVENFPISGIRFSRAFLRALGLIKASAARRSMPSSACSSRTLADAIQAAANEVADGGWDDEFPLDIFQTGSGTSTNTNANEVIATRAAQLLLDESNAPSQRPREHGSKQQRHDPDGDSRRRLPGDRGVAAARDAAPRRRR